MPEPRTSAPKAEARAQQKEKPAAPAPAPAPKAKRLSSKEQRELDELPALIAALEAEQKSITEKLADPNLYREQPTEVKKLNERYAQLDEQLMASLEKWEAIEARSKA